MVANAAAAFQRKGEAGDVRTHELDAVPYIQMEEILERLKLLNYEQVFLATFKPLTRTYFAMPAANPNEQFFYFTSLASWLMSLQHVTWRAPSQLDDPNSAVTALYAQLQQMGAPCNFPPQKLKQGYGEHCCSVLMHLLSQACGKSHQCIVAHSCITFISVPRNFASSPH